MKFEQLLSLYNLTPDFPAKAIFEVNKLGDKVSEDDLKGRLDLTGLNIMTIDGEDAKDFDDAISIEKLENGKFKLGVHIADVGHYVRENSAIDRAAFDRGTSVYLIDKVIPMLPFALSNELCSLKPDVVRLTVSVFMEVDYDGSVLNYSIHESYIKSKNRMTYTNVTKILEGDEELCSKYSDIVEDIKKMNTLAEILNKRRVKAGALEFITQESKITLDGKGRPINVEPYPNTVSNKIIEEFMLLCNETVAKHIFGKEIPLVYRVHEEPPVDKIQNLATILPYLGYNFRFRTHMKPKEFQKILNDVKGSSLESIVNSVVLRSMSKAKYSDRNLGHFGLASNYYCHFTSPIRRYPDLVVHRILKETLKGKLSGNRINTLKEFTLSAAISSSVAELNAADAEMEWKKVKMTEYMQDRIGEVYEGVISHILNSGFFVELKNTVEGFVPARLISDDIYVLSDNKISFIGIRTGKLYMVGDTLKIKVYAVDTEENDIDFIIYEDTENNRNIKTNGTKPRMYELNRDERKRLDKIKKEGQEKRKQKTLSGEKLNFELNVFKKAVARKLSDSIFEIRDFMPSDKIFINLNIKNLANAISRPVADLISKRSRDITSPKELVNFDLNPFEINAVYRTRQLLSSFNENFDLSFEKEFIDSQTAYVYKAIKLFVKSMARKDLLRSKREHEYERL